MTALSLYFLFSGLFLVGFSIDTLRKKDMSLVIYLEQATIVIILCFLIGWFALPMILGYHLHKTNLQKDEE